MSDHADAPMATTEPAPRNRFDALEETIIAATLGVMTVIVFANVIARHVFNSNILWSRELSVFLFAWLVLIGASYCLKKSQHLGVDLLLDAVTAPTRRLLGLAAAAATLAFCLIFLVSAVIYWSAFVFDYPFLETKDVPLPRLLAWLGDAMNNGVAYEKLPRYIPYFALPLGAALLTLRAAEQAWRIYIGDADRLIASQARDATPETATAPDREALR